LSAADGPLVLYLDNNVSYLSEPKVCEEKQAQTLSRCSLLPCLIPKTIFNAHLLILSAMSTMGSVKPSISHYQGDRFSVKYLYITNYRENFYALY
jgi:hypothetical protein